MYIYTYYAYVRARVCVFVKQLAKYDDVHLRRIHKEQKYDNSGKGW